MAAAGIAAAVALALLAAGCGGGATGPQSGGTLVVAEDQAPPILNTLLADGATVAGQHVVSNILQNLLTVDQDGRYVPQLATRVPAGDDVREGPLRVTFNLDPAARWSDGRRVTSADVIFTWRTMTASKNQIASRTGWSRIRSIEAGETAAGGRCAPATCFTVAFRGDYAPWRDVFSVSGGYYVLPRHVLRGRDFNTVWNEGGIVGSGPFTLQSVRPGVRAVLVRDPDWWGASRFGGGPHLDRIVVNFLDSPGAALAALRQREAQLITPPPDPDLLRRARATDGVTVRSVPSVFLEHIILNTQAAPLDDPSVRRALAYAIDRDQVVKVLLDGAVPVAESVLGPIQVGYEPAFERYSYRPDEAAALLERAGWTREGDGIFQKDGRPLRITLLTNSESDLRGTTARLLSQQARAAGIDLVPRSAPADRIFGGIITQGDFQALMTAAGSGVDPSVTAILASDQIPSEGNGFVGQNVYRWSDAAADRLMRLSDRQVDAAARARTLGRLQDIVAAQVPLIPLYLQPNTAAFDDSLTGVEVNPTQAEVFWNSATWSLRGGGG
ncbi:MAG: peptide ABC transporter substrate-binding protein [Thermoleophilia bacterium]